MKQLAETMKNVGTGATLPSFTAYDINGKLVSSTEMSSAPVAVIYTWATYNYDSQDMQRELKSRQKKSNGKLKLMAFCLMPARANARTTSSATLSHALSSATAKCWKTRP